MKTFFFFALLLVIGIIQKTHAQRRAEAKFNLEYITDYNIMLDGGCSNYTYDTADLNTNIYVFVIAATPTRTAFMKIAGNNENVFLKLVGKKPGKGDVDYHHVFTGGVYNVIVDTKKIYELDSFNNLYIGTLTIEHNGVISKIKVRGSVDKHAWQ